MKQFSNTSIDNIEPGHFHFECAMVSSCSPVFDHCSDNYEVEEELRKAKVIRKNNQTDTESCSLVVNFSTRESGEKFLERLNGYLEEKFEALPK